VLHPPLLLQPAALPPLDVLQLMHPISEIRLGINKLNQPKKKGSRTIIHTLVGLQVRIL
jgi:hypothetical protein